MGPVPTNRTTRGLLAVEDDGVGGATGHARALLVSLEGKVGSEAISDTGHAKRGWMSHRCGLISTMCLRVIATVEFLFVAKKPFLRVSSTKGFVCYSFSVSDFSLSKSDSDRTERRYFTML